MKTNWRPGRRFAAVAFAAALAVTPAAAQQQPGQGGLSGILRSITGQRAGALTQRDAALGLREALSLAATASTTRLGQVDGFFGDPVVRIPLPGLLGRAQRTLQPLGMAGPLDDLQLRMNRGAEAAMPRARQLFLDAIRGMTVSDAIGIVRGGDDAGTRYLREKSEANLNALLRPHMETALADAGVFTALDSAASRAGVSGGSNRLRADVINFAVTRALDGAFGYVAQEERAIRRDPAKRTTDILRRVFGA